MAFWHISGLSLCDYTSPASSGNWPKYLLLVMSHSYMLIFKFCSVCNCVWHVLIAGMSRALKKWWSLKMLIQKTSKISKSIDFYLKKYISTCLLLMCVTVICTCVSTQYVHVYTYLLKHVATVTASFYC